MAKLDQQEPINMKTIRIARPARALILAVVLLGAGFALAACGSENDDDHVATTTSQHAGHESGMTEAMEGGHGGHANPAMSGPQGLRASEGGFTVKAAKTTLPPGEVADYRFQIVDKHGMPVRDYEVDQERKLHLIVVRRDFAGYQHVHPKLGPDGTWSVPLRLAKPGPYRAFADFTVDGKRHTLGLDLRAPGHYAPEAMGHETTTSRSGPYEVTLEGAMPRAGQEGKLTFAVTKGGKPVDDLQPYLGGKCHLVALRHRDLAYLHVHPEGKGAGDAIPFMAEFPSAGGYQLFLQFRVDGKVRTAPFTVHVER